MSDAARPEQAALDRKVNILLADDRVADLLALRTILDGMGYNLVQAYSGEEVLRRVQEDEFAVILLDVQMHGLDGFETATRIRGEENTRHIPIIFLTAYCDDRFPVAEAYTLGAVDFLVKPVVPVILRAKVAGFVELFQKTEQVKRQAEQLRQLEHRAFEQRLAEENARLRESEQRFARFMQYLPGLAWIKDLEGRYVYANDAVEKAFCRPRSELYGKTDAEVFPPERAAQFQENDRQALASEAGVQVVATFPHNDGMEHHFVVSNFAMLGPDDKVGFVGGMAIDIDDTKRAEEALKQADRRKDDFLAMLAHELRNPLVPLRNGLQILKSPDADPDKVERAQTMMERQIRHLTRIVDDLLDVSRIVRAKVVLRTGRLDLGRFARVVAEDMRPAFDGAGLTLGVEVPEIPVWVMADATRLTQVLENLLQNAVKFTDAGGKVDIHVRIDEDRQQALLTVRDTGIGIGPGVLPHLFEAFAQADRSLERSKGGLGLGLTLIKGLVEVHGGEVHAFSQGPGRGAEFTVRLPLQPELAAVTQIPAAPQRAQQRLRVLVVEDNRDSADSLRMLLELFGYEVTVAYSGLEGVQAAEQWKPDVVLCDIGLPGLDGYGVVRKLRRNPATTRARIIAVTGYGAEDDYRRSKEAGFDQHMVKPVDPEALQQVLM